MTIRTRIAPSPTGIAHIGTAGIALVNYAFAMKHKGQFLIRIEDTDQTRLVAGAEHMIYDSLAWLGISHNEGTDIGGPYTPYRQSERLELYKQAALELIEKGHAYYCFCSPEILQEMRTVQQKQKQIPRYDRRCLQLSKTDIRSRLENRDKHVIRMRLPDNEVVSWKDLVRGSIEIYTKEMDDQVLVKSDGFPTYHLAVVVDDHAMKISHVIRGEEWIPSTPKHILLYRFFGWELPQFAHMPLLRNPDKTKMSKRKNDVSIPSYREKGFLPEALRNYLCLMGWSHPEGKDIFTIDEYIDRFSLDRVLTTGPIFDIEKLKWMNGKYIREVLSMKELFDRIKPFLKLNIEDNSLRQILPFIKDRLVQLSDVNDLLQFLTEETMPSLELLKRQHKQPEQQVASLLEEAKEELSDATYWEMELTAAATAMQHAMIKRKNLRYNTWTNKEFFMTLRVAITGAMVSPPLFESAYVLGRNAITQRLASLIQQLNKT